MHRNGRIAAALLLSLMFANLAGAGVIYLSTSATDPHPGVPSINLDVGQSMDFYLWFQVPSNEKVEAVCVDLVCSQPGVVQSVGSVTCLNPTISGHRRWDVGILRGTTGSPSKIIDNMRLFALDGFNYSNGIDGSFSLLDPTVKNGNSYLVAQVTVTGTQVGVTELSVKTNDGGGIDYDVDWIYLGDDPETGEEIFTQRYDPATTGFGTADDQVNPRGVGITGQYADAVIYVGVPEPMSLGVLAIGGLIFLRRR